MSTCNAVGCEAARAGYQAIAYEHSHRRTLTSADCYAALQTCLLLLAGFIYMTYEQEEVPAAEGAGQETVAQCPVNFT